MSISLCNLFLFIATDLSMLTLTSHDYSTVYSQEQNRLTETHERYAPSGLNKTNRVPNRTKMRETVTIKEVQKTVDTATSSSEVRPACVLNSAPHRYARYRGHIGKYP